MKLFLFLFIFPAYCYSNSGLDLLYHLFSHSANQNYVRNTDDIVSSKLNELKGKQKGNANLSVSMDASVRLKCFLLKKVKVEVSFNLFYKSQYQNKCNYVLSVLLSDVPEEAELLYLNSSFLSCNENFYVGEFYSCNDKGT